MIDQGRFQQLKKITPKSIKSELCGFDVNSNLIFVDKFWVGRSVDLEVGDYLATNTNLVIEKDCLEKIDESKKHIWIAKKPGITRMVIGDTENAVMVRVRK